MYRKYLLMCGRGISPVWTVLTAACWQFPSSRAEWKPLDLLEAEEFGLSFCADSLARCSAMWWEVAWFWIPEVAKFWILRSISEIAANCLPERDGNSERDSGTWNSNSLNYFITCQTDQTKVAKLDIITWQYNYTYD